MPLINCEVELNLPWLKDCVISQILKTAAVAADPNANSSVLNKAATQTTSAIFQINNAKLYLPVVTLSIKDNIEFLENIKQGFKRTIS